MNHLELERKTKDSQRWIRSKCKELIPEGTSKGKLLELDISSLIPESEYLEDILETLKFNEIYLVRELMIKSFREIVMPKEITASNSIKVKQYLKVLRSYFIYIKL